MAFVAIAVMILVPASFSSANSSFSIIYQVPEGHVGVYWRGGALLKAITEPDFHLKMPLITQFEPIQVTLQTDQIDEKMKDALQVDCTRYAAGIEILSVRVTNPTIPASIKCNFEQMKEERTKVLIVMEKQMVAEKEAEKQKKIALAEAEKNAQVSKILMAQKLMEKDSSKRQQEIENHMYMAREKSLADADFYKVMKEAEANKLKLTPEYLELSDNIMCVGLALFFSERPERPQHVILITVGGTKNGALHLMHGELHVLSPLVPIREVNFMLFCKQHAEGHTNLKELQISYSKVTDLGLSYLKGPSTAKDTGSSKGLSTTKAGGPLRHNSFPDPEPKYRGYSKTNGRGLDPHRFGPLVNDDDDVPQSNESFKTIRTDVPPPNEPSIPQSNVHLSNEPVLTNVPQLNEHFQTIPADVPL
ncbi:hypothetical protein GIB67_013691 [Kingdonia uniflora]|uniref:Band 7 domain-containing protein n=1 Tax=Kingdonia uniflora TaxID=39325 RepID=A0A7J7NPZ3_9MAGN|nr:hypothetical protein GIB67_013691 [Kingdonia uniflora]